MKHCDKCDIDINTNEKVCPICQAKIKGESNSVYPKLKNQTVDIVLKFIAFFSLVAVFISGYIDYIVNNKLTFSLFVMLGVLSFYIVVRYIFKSIHKNLLNVFYNIMMIVIILLFIWYGITKTNELVSIVIPIIIIIDLLLSTLLAVILRKNYIRKYIHVILMNVLFTFIPVLLVFFKFTTNLLTIHISFIFAVITVFYLIVFDFNSLKEEIHKMFHI
jgi:hypothetical protein